jgi:CBS domain-containing protein
MRENVGRRERVVRGFVGAALVTQGISGLRGRGARWSAVAALVAGGLVLQTVVTRVCPWNELLRRARPRAGTPGRRLSCRDVMTSDIVVLGTGESVAMAARKMRDLNVGFLPVCTSDQRLLGVVTDRDLALRVLAEERPAEIAVQDVMTDDIVACPVDAELDVAEALLRAHRKNRIPCVDEHGRVVGVISLADLARYTSPREAGDLLGEVAAREVHA